MKILFLTLIDFKSVYENGIYQDLLRDLSYKGHEIYAVSPVERHKGQKTHLVKSGNVIILKPRTGNIQKANLFEKGISTLSIEHIFISSIKKFFSNVKFDLIIYSTPPITFYKVIKFVKMRDNAKTYLLLKDIFPQNAIDLKIISKTGFRGLIYRFFREKEKKLYIISDYIGCMSQANVDYILNHNPVNPQKIEVFPNSIEVIDTSIMKADKKNIREKYGIPLNKIVFVYGGNLGKPQGIDFLIRCLDSQKNNNDVFFLIIGSGTEYKKLEKFVHESAQSNIRLLSSLPKIEYDSIVGSCDIGMIFLDSRFTIPNFPSRLLSYMQANLPVLAMTDSNTDVGKIIMEGKFGWWGESDNVENFLDQIKCIKESNLEDMGRNSFEYLNDFYNVKKNSYLIMTKLKCQDE